MGLWNPESVCVLDSDNAGLQRGVCWLSGEPKDGRGGVRWEGDEYEKDLGEPGGLPMQGEPGEWA